VDTQVESWKVQVWNATDSNIWMSFGDVCKFKKTVEKKSVEAAFLIC
jgi:hypothetical protein